MSGDILITVGRLLPWKGFGALIDIMPELLEKNPNFKLLIIGEGPEEENIRNKINKTNKKDNIIFIPGVEQKKLWQYMRASDLFILNTGYEGMPHLVIEAFMLGVPVITTLSGGNSEIVFDNENAKVVEYNNREQIKSAILNLWLDRDRQARLVENARQGLDKFDRGRMIEELVEVFRAVGG